MARNENYDNVAPALHGLLAAFAVQAKVPSRSPSALRAEAKVEALLTALRAVAAMNGGSLGAWCADAEDVEKAESLLGRPDAFVPGPFGGAAWTNVTDTLVSAVNAKGVYLDPIA